MGPAALVGLLLIGIVLVVLMGTGCLSLPLLGAERRAALRAEALLREMLSPTEYAQLELHGYLEVPSRCRPGRVYRVPGGRGLVTVIDDDVAVARLCLQPVQPIPRKELVLAHKVLLEAAEEDYWRQANVLGCWPGGGRRSRATAGLSPGQRAATRQSGSVTGVITPPPAGCDAGQEASGKERTT